MENMMLNETKLERVEKLCLAAITAANERGYHVRPADKRFHGSIGLLKCFSLDRNGFLLQDAANALGLEMEGIYALNDGFDDWGLEVGMDMEMYSLGQKLRIGVLA